MAKKPVDETPETTAASIAEAIKSDPEMKSALAAGEVAVTIPDPDEDEVVIPDTTADTEAGEETKVDLEDEIAAVADKSGVDFSLLEDCESVAEAERMVDKLYRMFAREGQQHAPVVEQPAPAMNGHSQSDDEELDLSDLQDDDVLPVAKAKKLLGGIKTLKGRFAELEKQTRAQQQAQVQQAQAQAAREFQQSLRRESDELFGSSKKQDARQQRREQKAFELASTILAGLSARGLPAPPFDSLARQVVRMEFADDISKTKELARKSAIEQRAKSRLGTPGRQSAPVAQVISAAPVGELKDDPDILAAVRRVQKQYS